MTDKPIRTPQDEVIIDGVDVSGCDFLTKEDDYCSYSGEYRAYKGQCGCSDEEMCKNHPNCFYKKALKQLKRKEQELQEAMDNYVQLDLQRVKEYNELVDLYKAKEQECEELKKDLHLNFKEKDKLHLIIDRLLEASGYDTNTASAKDFEDVYKNMRYEKQQLDQLKAEINKKELIFAGIETSNRLLIEKNNKLKQALTEIKEIAEENIRISESEGLNGVYRRGLAKQILQKISEVENDNRN